MQAALKKIEDAARASQTRTKGEKRAANAPNMLGAAIEAARARATVGEISDAMEKVDLHFSMPCRKSSFSSKGVWSLHTSKPRSQWRIQERVWEQR